MNYFTFCRSAIPAHVHLFVHPSGSTSSWPCCISGLHREDYLHQAGNQPPVSLTNSAQHLHVFQSHGRKTWPVMAPLHYTCPQDHWGKDSLTPSFPSLRKKDHTHLQLISLLKQYSSGCFSGVSVLLTKTVPTYVTRTHLCAEEESVPLYSLYPQKDTVIPLAKFSSPAKPPGICIHFSCTNMM